MKTYVFEVEIEQEEDGRWSVIVPVLPGCNAWGYTREETMEAIRDTTRAFVEIMLEYGDTLPPEAEEESVSTSESDMITVAV